MPKTRRSMARKTFDYSKDRKKVKRKMMKKRAPTIENVQIRNAWDDSKSMATNLSEMGLSFDPNRTLPIKQTKKIGAPVTVRKPYLINQLEEEASRRGKDTRSLSSDLIEYVQHMVREHGDNYKAMARDEKNYYQDTPKQIKKKIDKYMRFHPEHYAAFMQSLAAK